MPVPIFESQKINTAVTADDPRGPASPNCFDENLVPQSEVRGFGRDSWVTAGSAHPQRFFVLKSKICGLKIIDPNPKDIENRTNSQNNYYPLFGLGVPWGAVHASNSSPGSSPKCPVPNAQSQIFNVAEEIWSRVSPVPISSPPPKKLISIHFEPDYREASTIDSGLNPPSIVENLVQN